MICFSGLTDTKEGIFSTEGMIILLISFPRIDVFFSSASARQRACWVFSVYMDACIIQTEREESMLGSGSEYI